MATRGVITYTGAAAMSKKDFRGIVKTEMQEVAVFWHKKYLPGHFTVAGGIKYGYRKRGKAYMERKLALHGHQNPLIWSGALKQQVSRMVKITGSAKKVSAYMTGPFYTSYLGKDKELTETRYDEVRTMARLLNKKMTRGIDRIDKKVTRRI